MRPEIIITQAISDPTGYQIICHGRYGGGYSLPCKNEADTISILARDGRTYDCGDEPILIIAPEEIKVAAGL